MRNFNDNRRSGGGSRGGFGGRKQGRSEMFQATCSDCGKSCEVPFKPRGDKPVYCNDCFRRGEDSGSGRSGRSGDRRSGGRDFGKAGFGEKRMYEATCAKCGSKCEVPFRPTSDKPVYCNDCFGESKGRDFGPKKPDQSKEQFEQLNKKLDKILRVLEIISPKKIHIIKKSEVKTESSDSSVEASAETEDKEEVKKPAKKKTPAKKTSKKKAPAKKAAKKTTKKTPAKKKGK